MVIIGTRQIALDAESFIRKWAREQADLPSFRVQESGSRVLGLGCRVSGWWFWVLGPLGLGFRI